MSEIFYEEDFIKKPAKTGGSSKMAQWLINKGIVKSETAAAIVLICIAIVAILLTILIIKGDDIKNSFKSSPEPELQQINFQERRAERLNR